jgi:hypothetical protein
LTRKGAASFLDGEVEDLTHLDLARHFDGLRNSPRSNVSSAPPKFFEAVLLANDRQFGKLAHPKNTE